MGTQKFTIALLTLAALVGFSPLRADDEEKPPSGFKRIEFGAETVFRTDDKIPLVTKFKPFDRANAVKLIVEWDCPQSRKTGMPSNEEFTVLYDPENYQLEAPAIDALIKKAIIPPSNAYDFFGCLTGFTNNLNREVRKKNIALKIPILESKMEKMFGKINAKVALYGREAFEKQALAPALLGEPLQTAPSSEKKRKISKSLFEFSCGGVESNLSSAYFLDLEFLKEDLPKLISKIRDISGPETTDLCLRRMAWGYSHLLSDLGLGPAECLSNPELCASTNQGLKKVLHLIANTPGLDDYFREPYETNLECEPNLVESEKFLRDLSFKIKLADQCVDLKEGESQLINGELGTGVSSNYTLSRLPDQDGKPVYRVLVNPWFKPGNPDLERQVENCLEKAKDHLKGPNGEKLVIQVWDPELKKYFPDLPEPAVTAINVQNSEDRRMEPTNWNKTSSCAEDIHEISHLLGLPDVYPERGQGFSFDSEGMFWRQDAQFPGLDCRSIGPTDSLMYIHYLAWGGVVGIPVVDKNSQTSVSYFTKKSEGGDVVDHPIRESLYYPAEFRSIIHPGCYSKNRVFYQCASEAYVTSREAYGRGSCAPGLPKECKGGDEWLR